MPLTSVLATLVGGLLIFWNTLVLAIKRVARRFSKVRARPVFVIVKGGEPASPILPAPFPGSAEFDVR